MRAKTYRVAVGGILSALAVSVMFLGSVIPFATYISPALASLAVLYFAVEYNTGAALLVYAAISALALLIAPDKEQALLFACFLGWYPAAKLPLERKLRAPAALIVKLALCNASLFSLYYIITRVLVIAAVRDEFAEYSTAIVIALAVLGNLTFVIFDRALTRLAMLWLAKWRPRLTGEK